jgi:hypothetical protein
MEGRPRTGGEETPAVSLDREVFENGHEEPG